MYDGIISMADAINKTKNIERDEIEKQGTNKLKSTFSAQQYNSSKLMKRMKREGEVD